VSAEGVKEHKIKKRSYKRMTVKRTITAMVFVLSLAFSQFANAQGIPVYDNSANTSNMLQYGQLVKQLAEMQEQYKMLEQTYKTLTTTSKSYGVSQYNRENDNYVDEEYQKKYDEIRGGNVNNVNQELTDNQIDVNAMCGNLGEKQQVACKRQVALAAQDKAFTQKAFTKAKNRLDQIRRLMGEISGTKEQKDILELSARIQAEQAILQNESIKVQLYKITSENERRLAELQARSASAKSMGSNINSSNTTLQGGINFPSSLKSN
jgi:type IV secretion system protein VirB5